MYIHHIYSLSLQTKVFCKYNRNIMKQSVINTTFLNRFVCHQQQEGVGCHRVKYSPGFYLFNILLADALGTGNTGTGGRCLYTSLPPLSFCLPSPNTLSSPPPPHHHYNPNLPQVLSPGGGALWPRAPWVWNAMSREGKHGMIVSL